MHYTIKSPSKNTITTTDLTSAIETVKDQLFSLLRPEGKVYILDRFNTFQSPINHIYTDELTVAIKHHPFDDSKLNEPQIIQEIEVFIKKEKPLIYQILQKKD